MDMIEKGAMMYTLDSAVVAEGALVAVEALLVARVGGLVVLAGSERSDRTVSPKVRLLEKGTVWFVEELPNRLLYSSARVSVL